MKKKFQVKCPECGGHWTAEPGKPCYRKIRFQKRASRKMPVEICAKCFDRRKEEAGTSFRTGGGGPLKKRLRVYGGAKMRSKSRWSIWADRELDC